MAFFNNMQEFIGLVMIPFGLIAGGALLAMLLLLVIAATAVNALDPN